MKKKIAVLQMEVALGDPDYNFHHMEGLMKEAMKGKPDILVMPETWNTGFYISRKLKEIADENGEHTRLLCSRFAKEYGVHLVAGSTAVKEGDAIYNRAMIFNRAGECIATYDKMHGFNPAHESVFFTPGHGTVSFMLDDISCSMAICYDLRFPEWIRRQILEHSVDLFFLPAAWPKIRHFQWDILIRARAIENQMYFCAVNQGGGQGKAEYGGHSLLVNPLGETVAQGGDKEEIFYGEFDGALLHKVRERLDSIADRRPEFDTL
jgi:hypothetical protein